mmetsp:Transcript_19419/g.48902  ORF Transcript_19419/g.48902 Transcript_19419/m.48902 type:complete len:91 (-) Transcript_19419:117-389(-)
MASDRIGKWNCTETRALSEVLERHPLKWPVLTIELVRGLSITPLRHRSAGLSELGCKRRWPILSLPPSRSARSTLLAAVAIAAMLAGLSK